VSLGALLTALLIVLVCACAGALIARSKGRPIREGLLLGGLFSGIGVLIEISLEPKPLPGMREAGWYPDPGPNVVTPGLMRYWNGRKWTGLVDDDPLDDEKPVKPVKPVRPVGKAQRRQAR
jgi:hypothetical protein